MTNQHSKFCGNTCPSTSTHVLTNSFCSQHQSKCSSELASLTSLLVHLCLTGSDVCEQQSIASFILKKFEKEINKMSTTFDFLEASPIFISSPTTSKSELIVTKEFKTKKLPNRNSVKSSISFSGENEEKIKKKSGNISKNIELNKSFKEEKQNQKKPLKSFPGRLSKSKSLKTKNSFKSSKNEESSSSLQRPSSKRKIKQKSNIVGMLKSKSEINLFTKISENKSKLRRPNTSGGNLNKKLKSPICSAHKSRQQQKRTFSFDNKNEKQLFKKEINSTNNPTLLEYIIKSFEFTNDSLCLFVFCKLINGYIEYSENLVKQNRLRFLVKLDLISHLLRVIRKRFEFFEKWEILDNLIVDFLAKIILLISEKDKKFVLKVRLSGVLTLLANYLFFNDSIDKQNINLFKLLIKSLQSSKF
uniref:Uncharacterized protein n=1 Tax=Meloidogyne enterolobii TaxID=390850 RepID=A0A6V7VME3_MELEN|nr:unnamed protein product [Meloidogyne enterolobii]